MFMLQESVQQVGGDYNYTSGTPAFGQDINGSYTITNIATIIVIPSYYAPLNFEFAFQVD